MNASRIISYAQNFEDVLLWRALSAVEEGFYVDVGAQDPEVDSVTKLFYDRGWRGLNIEPVPSWHERLCRSRPRDINLRCAASSRSGTLTIHEVAASGLSTSSEAYARRHAGAGRSISTLEVVSRTLDEMLEEHALDPIHFLKIDVEGMEADVLAGLSLAKFRPWIVVLEATEPNSVVDVSAGWESSLTDSGYRLAHNDGLNRYYVAEEQAALAERLRLPPNVFDDFIPYTQVRMQEYAHDLETRLRSQFENLADARESAEKLRANLAIVARAAEEREVRVRELDAIVMDLQMQLQAVLVVAQNRERRISELERDVSERDVLVHDTALQVSGLRADMAALVEAAENRARRIEALEEIVNIRDAQVDTAERQASQLRTDLANVAIAAENRARRIVELEAEIRASQLELSGLKDHIEESSKLRWRLAETNDELRRTQLRVDLLRGERDALREVDVLAQSHIHALTTKLEDSHARLVGLHDDLSRVMGSRSWRVTRPLRDGAKATRSVLGKLLNAASRSRWMRESGRILLPHGSTARRRLLAIGGIRTAVPSGEPVADAPLVAMVGMTREARRANDLVSRQAESEQRSTFIP